MNTITLSAPAESSPVQAAIQDAERALFALDMFDGDADSAACKVLCDAYKDAHARLEAAMKDGLSKSDAAAFGDFAYRRLIADGSNPKDQAMVALRVTVDALRS